MDILQYIVVLWFAVIRTWLTVNECCPWSLADPTPPLDPTVPPLTIGADGHPVPWMDMVMSGAACTLRIATGHHRKCIASVNESIDSRCGGHSDCMASGPPSPRFRLTFTVVMRARHAVGRSKRCLASGVCCSVYKRSVTRRIVYDVVGRVFDGHWTRTTRRRDRPVGWWRSACLSLPHQRQRKIITCTLVYRVDFSFLLYHSRFSLFFYRLK